MKHARLQRVCSSSAPSLLCAPSFACATDPAAICCITCLTPDCGFGSPPAPPPPSPPCASRLAVSAACIESGCVRLPRKTIVRGGERGGAERRKGVAAEQRARRRFGNESVQRQVVSGAPSEHASRGEEGGWTTVPRAAARNGLV